MAIHKLISKFYRYKVTILFAFLFRVSLITFGSTAEMEAEVGYIKVKHVKSYRQFITDRSSAVHSLLIPLLLIL